MDWNWFYSTVAQSTAALVGVFFAFIIAKLVNDEQSVNRYKSKVGELHTDFISLRDRLLLFKGEFSRINSEIYQDSNVLLAIQTRLRTREGVLRELNLNINYSPFDNRTKIISKFENRMLEIVNRNLQTGDGVIINIKYACVDLSEKLELLEKYRRLFEMNDLVNSIRRKALHAVNEIRSFELSKKIIVSALKISFLLLLSGVVVPFILLPYSEFVSFSVDKLVIILTIFSLLGVSDWFLGSYYAKLVISQEDKSKLDAIMALNSYIEYIRNYNDNQANDPFFDKEYRY